MKITPQNGSALTTKFTVQMGEGWIDPEGDRVVFYVHTERVDEGKVRRMSPRPLTDIVSYDMMLGTGEAIRGSRGGGVMGVRTSSA